jgi:hypothetical protein
VESATWIRCSRSLVSTPPWMRFEWFFHNPTAIPDIPPCVGHFCRLSPGPGLWLEMAPELHVSFSKCGIKSVRQIVIMWSYSWWTPSCTSWASWNR